MLFSSMLFLWIFLPAVIALNFIAIKLFGVKGSNVILLLSSSENVTLNIIIENTETHEFYSVDTSTVARQDVNRVFNEGNDKKYNYERSGFTARIPRNRLDDDDSNYNLYMLYTQKGEEPVLVNLKTTLRE